METKATRHWPQLLGSIASIGLGGALIFELPVLVGVSWTAIGENLDHVPLLALIGLVALWFTGLLVHAPVLMAAMPGLSAGQALTLNMSGSAASNVLPLGGPAGMGLGYAMARSWGFRPDSYASYLVSTNLWNMVGRFVTAVSILAGAALLGVRLPAGLGAVVVSAVVFMVLCVGSAVAAFRTPGATAAVGRRLDTWARKVRPATAEHHFANWLLDSRAELVTAVRAGWFRMSSGVLAYLVLQAALLLACLTAAGAHAAVGVVAIAFAIERLISLAPITPGAAGLAEVGTVAALHSLGVGSVSAAAAGVVLYRILMFAIDIPIGGALALNWLRVTRRTSIVLTAPRLAPALAYVNEQRRVPELSGTRL